MGRDTQLETLQIHRMWENTKDSLQLSFLHVPVGLCSLAWKMVTFKLYTETS